MLSNHNTLIKASKEILKKHLKVEDRNIFDSLDGRYPVPDFWIEQDGKYTPVECGKIAGETLDIKDERIKQLLYKYGQLIHIPYPEEIIIGIPLYRIIIFQFHEKEYVDKIKEEYKELRDRMFKIDSMISKLDNYKNNHGKDMRII